jgi:hypothetical protein
MLRMNQLALLRIKELRGKNDRDETLIKKVSE